MTIMQMDEGLDMGGILATSEIVLDSTITSSKLHDILADIGGSLTLDVLEHIEEFEPVPQDDAQATYAHLLKKSDGQIDWSQTAPEIDRQVRALNPWPGVWTTSDGKRFKILGSSVSAASNPGSAGELVNKDGDVVCGDGSVLTITKIQPEGKAAMDFASAMNGGYVQIGQVFS